MKRLLVLFIFLSFGLTYGQFAETPQYEFNSTSSYQYMQRTNQYTIPVSEIQEPFYNPNTQYAPIRRAPGYDPADPGMENVPVGDPDIYVITFLLVSYLVCYYLKNRKSQMLLLNIQKQ